jgi:hypothetical protein
MLQHMTSGCDHHTTAAGSSPIHARTLTVARCICTNIPGATGRTTRAAGDDVACGWGPESLNPRNGRLQGGGGVEMTGSSHQRMGAGCVKWN